MSSMAKDSDVELEEVLGPVFARNVRDNVMAEIIVQGLRVSGMIVLARQLLPADFGVFKVLLVVGMLATLANECGFADALIQRKELRYEHESTTWWIGVASASGTAIVLYEGASLIARVMAMPALVGGVRLLCIPFMLEGIAMTANARLRRRMKFGALALADVIGEAVFLIVALIVLWNGSGQWSLPLGLSARYVVHAIAVLLADRVPPLGAPTIVAARELGGFASSVLGAKLLYILSNNADYLLVGRLLGSTALGFYVIAWDLLRFVPDRLHRVAGRVTMPAFCLVQDDIARLAKAYLDFFGYIARVVLPLVACIVVAAPEIVVAVYGRQWEPAALPLRLLAAGLGLAGLRIGIGSVYYSKNRPSLDLYIHGARLILIIAVCTGFASTGLAGVSAAMSCVEGVISVVAVWFACELVDLSPGDLVRASIPALKLSLVCAAATICGKVAAQAVGLNGAAVLATVLPPPAIVYCWMEAPMVKRMLAEALRGREGILLRMKVQPQ